MGKRYTAAGGLLAAALLAGCIMAAGTPRTEQPATATILDDCRILVLPFVNESDSPNAGAVATRIFQAALFQVSGIASIPEGDVRTLYRQLRLPPTSLPEGEQRRVLASRLDAPFLVRGRVVTMTAAEKGREAEPEVALEVAVIKSDDGRVLASTYHRRRGGDYRKILHFGAVRTITGLTRLVSEEIVARWQEEGVLRCRD